MGGEEDDDDEDEEDALVGVVISRMPPPSSIKKEFLKKWLVGLKALSNSRSSSTSKKEMSVLERKKAIKLSADVAMASLKNGTTSWSRALIQNASKDGNNRTLLKSMLGSEYDKKLRIGSTTTSIMCSKGIRNTTVLRRSCGLRRARKISKDQRVRAGLMAKRLVKKRTQVLRSLVPGGEYMDEYSLFEETLDYIMSLRAQVDVMRRLANASAFSSKS
ncbi:hypothetical protein RJ641_025389 [Dillenia turbinata]|uniref:IBH1-like N-terminal domain-containing protein n=1 Tax=Dillenia turbinata TaxID=194707 RepID=A0AAN8W9Q1_9MAGN